MKSKLQQLFSDSFWENHGSFLSGIYWFGYPEADHRQAVSNLRLIDLILIITGKLTAKDGKS